MSGLLRSAVSYLSGSDADEFVGATVDLESHQLSIKHVIGDGGYGKVYKAISLKDANEYALKRLFVPEDAVKKVQYEISLSRKLSGHPNIVAFLSAAAHPSPDRRGFAEFLILMEFCPGSLMEVIRRAGPRLFTSGEVIQLFHGVCQAVNHLHTLPTPIIHRDIKAENVIFAANGTVKLCDFGSATTRVITPTDDWSAQQRGVLEDEVQCNTTPCYRSPEMIDYYSNSEIGTAADVWALGCFLYYTCYFELPFDDNKLAIVNAKWKTPNEHLVMFAPFIPIMKGVFKVDPKQRPSTAQMLQLVQHIAKEKDIDPSLPPFPDFIRRQSTSIPSPTTPLPAGQQNNSRASWIGYFKGGAENLLKEAKGVSEKVVASVVNASNLNSGEHVDEGQLTVTSVTSRIVAISFSDPATIEVVQQMMFARFGGSCYFFNLTDHEFDKEVYDKVHNAGWQSLVPPPMCSLLEVVSAIDRWLLVSPDNVAVIHCKDGTGNTALAISTFLMTCGMYKSAHSALQYYAASRYPNTSGIITASQKRYAEYVERMVYDSSIHSHMTILCSLTLSTVPLFSVNRSSCKPFLEVYEGGKKILSTLREPDVMRTFSAADEKVEIPINMGVKGDVRIVVYHARNFIGGKMSAIKMFQFCFNTAFIEPDAASIRLPKSRLDGIARHPNKFPPPFDIFLELSVAVDPTSEDSPYKLETSSLGITPPICCGGSEEFQKMLAKVPDKGCSKSERRASEAAAKKQIKNIKWEEEREEEREDEEDMFSEDQLIDIMSGHEELPSAPMSDPMNRKSGQAAPLLDFCQQSHSSSAPNLTPLAEPKEDEFADFFSGPSRSTAPPSRAAPPPAAKLSSTGPTQNGHKREKSVNLMELSSDNEILNNFDMLGMSSAKITLTQPPPAPVSSVQSSQGFDPFYSAPGAPDPFATPQPLKIAQPKTGPNLGSPLVPMRLGGSGFNSPVANRSRPTTPATSPTVGRKNMDPFSDFKIDLKGGQVSFDTTTQKTTSPSLSQRNSAAGLQQGQLGQLGQLGQQGGFAQQQMRPNYFASSASSGPSSVFGSEQASKPWQQTSNSAKQDTFGDLLSGASFKSAASKAPVTMKEQRREELEKTMDPIKLKIQDWTQGKRNNIRALLSSLSDVLWDGEDRWTKPGMHLMIDPIQVKKIYRNASRVVHPDKQVGSANEELAKAIQMELNDAYAEFENAELR